MKALRLTGAFHSVSTSYILFELPGEALTCLEANVSRLIHLSGALCAGLVCGVVMGCSDTEVTELGEPPAGGVYAPPSAGFQGSAGVGAQPSAGAQGPVAGAAGGVSTGGVMSGPPPFTPPLARGAVSSVSSVMRGSTVIWSTA